MKRMVTTILWIGFCGMSASAQTITLQPAAAAGKDALLDSRLSTTNFGASIDFASLAWTNGGTPVVGRSLVEFDLSGIPAGAIINSAELSLYSYNSPANGSHSNLSGSNSSVIERVTSAWNESTVTWATQPTTTTTNSVTLAASSMAIQDYLNIDVKLMVQDMIASGNNGFMIKLLNENYYRRMIFGSSDNTTAALRPKLVINYTTCVTLRPEAQKGKDALLDSRLSTTNFGTSPDFASLAWTNGGTPVTGRSLVEFDLTGIPSGSTIISGELSLFSYNSPANGSHSNLSGSNSSVIERVTSAWNESTVTWATQPTTTTTNSVTLAASTSSIQDYPNINVTAQVQDMIDIANYGFMIKLVTESYYRRMIFASSDNTNSALHPMLKVCYQPAMARIVMNEDKSVVATLYPNPAAERVTVAVENREGHAVTLRVVNAQGQVLTVLHHSGELQDIDVSGYPNGLYFVNISVNGKTTTQKLIVE